VGYGKRGGEYFYLKSKVKGGRMKRTPGAEFKITKMGRGAFNGGAL